MNTITLTSGQILPNCQILDANELITKVKTQDGQIVYLQNARIASIK